METEEDVVVFYYRNREEYINRRNKLFTELKENIYFSDNVFKLLLYSGIKSCYKMFDITSIIKKHLNVLTNLSQQEWVDDVCWHIFRTVESSIDTLPLRILKKFENSELEKYILNIIENILLGGDTIGFMSFIEDKNLYIEDDIVLSETVELEDELQDI
tara:strand:- start:356 stop:832 length:477 start_codon:yes stop_codon:yes gene_type:complete